MEIRRERFTQGNGKYWNRNTPPESCGREIETLADNRQIRAKKAGEKPALLRIERVQMPLSRSYFHDRFEA